LSAVSLDRATGLAHRRTTLTVGGLPFAGGNGQKALGTTTIGVWPLRDVAGLDRDLAVFMPDPTLVRDPDPDEGAPSVTLTSTVEDDHMPRFLEVMADPSPFLQVSEFPTWGEHLRQHTGRLTGPTRPCTKRPRRWPPGRPRCDTCSSPRPTQIPQTMVGR
jgi:hypothetical protein